MIEYKNISFKEYYDLSVEERKTKSFCIEYSNGTIYWRVNNIIHREDGPAIEFSNGINYWYLNGFWYPIEEWLEKTPILDEEKVFLRIKYL